MSKDDALADLADAVVALAHYLELRGAAAREVATLSGVEITVVREIHRAPARTATEIAEITGLQRSNVSTAAHALERAGLVRRCDPAGGGRGVGFAVTETAEEQLRRVRAFWVKRLEDVPATLWSDFERSVAAVRR